MVPQAARRADHDVRALAQRAPLLGRVHAADAGGDPRARRLIKPGEFAADLQSQLARGGDDERERRAGLRQPVALHQVGGERQPERHRLARARARGDEQVAAGGLVRQHGGLNGRGLLIPLFVEGVGERGGEGGKGHGGFRMECCCPRVSGPGQREPFGLSLSKPRSSSSRYWRQKDGASTGSARTDLGNGWALYMALTRNITAPAPPPSRWPRPTESCSRPASR